MIKTENVMQGQLYVAAGTKLLCRNEAGGRALISATGGWQLIIVFYSIAEAFYCLDLDVLL